MSGPRSFVPWDTVAGIRADDFEMRGALIREPFIAIDVNDRGRVETSRLGRALMRANKHLFSDLSYSTRQLDVDPSLVFQTMVFYWNNADRRKELAASDSVERVNAMRLTSESALS